MDNLVLTTVAVALARGLSGAALVEIFAETDDRFRFRWELDGRTLSTLVSLRPDGPWIGRPARRAPRRPASRHSALVARLRREFRGAVLETVVKGGSDRLLEWRFMDGRRWVVELAPHGANLVSLDAEGRVVASLHRPRSARERLTPGATYRRPARPESQPDPWTMTAEGIDDVLERWGARGEPVLEALRRHLFGVGTAAAKLVCEESIATGRSPGLVLAERLHAAQEQRLEPVIETTETTSGRSLEDPAAVLWPWEPAREPAPGRGWRSGPDAAATAGLWYEMRDAERGAERRFRALRQIVRREVSRCDQSVQRCTADLRGFESPERYRRWAEALLAGLPVARRDGATIRVPDPENPGGGDLVFEGNPASPLPRIAEELFARHRRAVRGLLRAQARLDELTERAGSLAALERLFAEGASEEVLLEALRRLRLPIALEPTTRGGREQARMAPPRLEGVRVYYASTGEMILAGKGARHNHRLTFRLSAPHDIWLHASEVPGAHVILRQSGRGGPPGPALLEAAAIAAWHSESRSEEAADVRWTQRKNVKKPRGAKPGIVVLKRFETVRVRPRIPPESESRRPTLGRSSKT